MAKYQLVLTRSNSEMIPEARSGHRCATDGVFLFSYGGFSPKTKSRLFNDKMWCFHLSSKTWHKFEFNKLDYNKGITPRCVASSTMVLREGSLIVFGGSGYPFGMNNSNETFIWSLRQKCWSNLFPMPGDSIPNEGYGQGAVVGPDNCMYIFGGTKGLIYNSDLHKLDLNTKQWKHIECHNQPSARYRHEMVGIEGGFLVIGGYGVAGACPLDKLPMYSYDNCSWTEVTCNEDFNHGFPKPRRAHSCVKFEDDVYISGGYDEALPSISHVFADIWKLNVQTFSWFKLPQVLPNRTYFHSAAVTSEGCMYIFGGIERTAQSEERTSNVLQMWLVVPPLESLCWQQMCDSVLPSEKLDTNKLSQLGVPRYLLLRYRAQFD